MTSVYNILSGIIGENAAKKDQSVDIWLDTGLVELNRALSGRHEGGFPVGRIVEIFGPESSGKCQPASTMVLGQDGLISIEEMFELCGYKAVCTSKDVEHQYGLVNEKGEIEKTSHLTWNNRKKIVRLVGKNGFITEATMNHPLRVMDSRGRIVWRKAQDINVGDYLPIMRGTNQYGSGNLTDDEAKFIGYLIADGTLSRENKWILTNSDKEVSDWYQNFVLNVLGVSKCTESKEVDKAPSFTSYGVENREMLIEKYGLDVTKAAGKKVPLCVRTAKESAQKAFVRAYFELECHIDNTKQTIEVCSASRKLLSDIQLMLVNMGIWSRIRDKPIDDVKYYRLTLDRNEAAKYVNLIGFETTARIASSRLITSSSKASTVDKVPHLSATIRSIYESCDTSSEDHRVCEEALKNETVSYKHLEAIIDLFNWRVSDYTLSDLNHLKMIYGKNFFYEQVESIEEDYVPTFDVAMPVTHSFWANGFISHNTFLATQAMIAAQKAGGIAGFNDHERSFDVGLAEAMGLSTELDGRWIYKRPKTFEESVDIAIMAATAIRENKLIPDDAPIVWVFDSVPSMIPQEVLFTKDSKGNLKRRESDDHNMRTKLALAAATSIHYPILAQFAEDNNMLVLLLNQIRLDPSVIHGNPEKTPGGQAGKYYPSIRISLGRQLIDNGMKGDRREVYGQRITASCIKNKVTRPFGKASYDVMFNQSGPGCQVDRIGAMVDYLIKVGAIPQSGAWIEWEGKKTYRKTLVELLKNKMTEEDAMAKLNALVPELAEPDVGEIAMPEGVEE